jgi:hypothetical protein
MPQIMAYKEVSVDIKDQWEFEKETVTLTRGLIWHTHRKKVKGRKGGKRSCVLGDGDVLGHTFQLL